MLFGTIIFTWTRYLKKNRRVLFSFFWLMMSWRNSAFAIIRHHLEVSNAHNVKTMGCWRTLNAENINKCVAIFVPSFKFQTVSETGSTPKWLDWHFCKSCVWFHFLQEKLSHACLIGQEHEAVLWLGTAGHPAHKLHGKIAKVQNEKFTCPFPHSSPWLVLSATLSKQNCCAVVATACVRQDRGPDVQHRGSESTNSGTECNVRAPKRSVKCCWMEIMMN